MPPPSISMRFGAKRISSAAVESQMRGSDGMKPGATGSEPAATIALAKRTVRGPSAVSTRSVFGEVNAPSPVTTVTLRWRARPVRPVVRRLTTESFQSRIAFRSMVGGPNDTPCAAIAAASSMTLATCSSALDGMQPTLRQTPPSVGRLSTMQHLLAEVGGAEGGGVAAGPGAEHHQIGLEIDMRRRRGRRARNRRGRRATRPRPRRWRRSRSGCPGSPCRRP